MAGHAEGERVFEALWAPRWFGQDQSVAHGQESVFHFRGAIPPDSAGGLIVLAAGLDRPRYPVTCRVLGLKHDQLGRLQAIHPRRDGYRFVLHNGDIVELDAAGGVVGGTLEQAPPDWTVRVVFEVLPADA
ncbi:MAG: hypothetical protein AAGE52_27760 [Myxococcota bacterium]